MDNNFDRLIGRWNEGAVVAWLVASTMRQNLGIHW